MITFITTRPHPINHPRITIVSTLQPLLDWLSITKEICFDKEFNGLNVLNTIPLLSQYGDEENQFVVDDVSFPSLSYLEPFKHKTFIGHNIKIDISVARLQGINIRNVYDTMIVEQRLGLDSKRQNTLEATYERRLNKLMLFKREDGNSKSFIGMTKVDLFRTNQILYSADDVRVLLPIKKEQSRLIAKFNMFFLMQIENRDVPIIVDAELEGIAIDEEKWKANIEDNKKKQITVEKKLDGILHDIKINDKPLLNNKRERVLVEVEQTNLFGFDNRIVTTPQKSRINYSSSDQVLRLFDLANIPKPTQLNTTKNKITGEITYEDKESIGEEALQKYQIEKPDNILREFIDGLLEYKEVDKELSSFGEKFLHSRIPSTSGYTIGFKNDKTGKVHTYYKQVETTTGRLSSGNAKIGFFNSQQIPAIKKYREAFILTSQEVKDGWFMTTCDLTGAEVVIMCAFAKDKRLYKWAVEEDDLHSPMATLCWRAIAEDRIRRNKSLEYKDTRGGIHLLSPDILVTKHDHKQMRVDFKPETFGIVYGANDKTAASAVNIPVHEGKIIVDIIKENIPDTFAMVEQAARDARNQGYLVFNTRTNSRKYFDAIIRGNPNPAQLKKIEGEARNARIQGTQSDMVKEAMYKIHDKFEEQEVENCMLLQIHDELVWKHRSFTPEKAEEHAKIIEETMAGTGTLYLEGFTAMKAEAQTLFNWTK